MAGEKIDRDLRQRNLPFYLNKNNLSGDLFSFKLNANKRLGVLPEDHNRHGSDLGSKLQVGINPWIGTKLELYDILENIPCVNIREYTQDTRVDYVLSIAKIFTKGLADGEKVASGTFDFGTIREAFGLMIHDIKTLDSPFWTNVGNAFISKSVFGDYGQQDNETDKTDKQALIDFVYSLYYEMVTTTTTNRYTLPFNVQDNVMKGNGTDGWDSFSMNGSFMEHMGALTGFLGKGISIYTTPVWQGIKNSEGYGFDMTINLFNDTLDHTLANFIFVNTLIPQNMPTHYAVFQQAPSVYDIQIEGFQRLFMCSGDFSCSMKGVVRKPSSKFIEQLVNNHGNEKYKFDKEKSPIKDIRIPDVYEVHLTFKSLLPNTFNNFIFQYVNVSKDMVTLQIKKDRPGWGEDDSIPNAIKTWGEKRFKDGKDLSIKTNAIKEQQKLISRIDTIGDGQHALEIETEVLNKMVDELKKTREKYYKQ